MKLRLFNSLSVLSATGTLILSPAALAHSGHGHTQLDTLSTMLHSLTTHPLIFGVVGLIFMTAVYMSRR